MLISSWEVATLRKTLQNTFICDFCVFTAILTVCSTFTPGDRAGRYDIMSGLYIYTQINIFMFVLPLTN